MTDDVYTRLTRSFAQKHDLTPGDIGSQWNIVGEEIDEMNDAFEEFHASQAWHPGGPSSLTEEMADVLFTLHLAAEMLGVDLREAFIEKAKYNLQKSTDRGENGKITDDAG